MSEQAPPQRRFTRFIRVPTPGLRARVDVVDGDLIDISVSGVLVRTESELPVGSEGSLLLDLGASPITVKGQVTRCEPARPERQGERPSQSPTYVVGVRFIEPSRAAQRTIIGLCGGSQTIEEWPYQIVVLGENAELNDLVLRILRKGEYQVTAARDPETAVHTAKETHADAILVSAALTPELLATRRPTKRTPIIAFAAPDSLTPTERRVLDEHQIPLLIVPFTEGDLLAAARLALRQP